MSKAPCVDSNSLLQWLQHTHPKYEYFVRAGSVIVPISHTVGVSIRPRGPGFVKMGWSIPKTGTLAILILAWFLAVIPGLVLVLIIWLVGKKKVEALQTEMTQHLQNPGSVDSTPIPPWNPPPEVLLKEWSTKIQAMLGSANAGIQKMSAQGGNPNAQGSQQNQYAQPQQGQPGGYPQAQGYQQQQAGYPQQPQPGYQQQQPQPQAGYPQQQASYQQPQAGYPQQQAGYPQPQAGYQQPQAGPQPAAPGHVPSHPGYPQPPQGYPPTGSNPGY